jgi:hypothetical protein
MARDHPGCGLLFAEVDADVAVAEAGGMQFHDRLARPWVRVFRVDDADVPWFEESKRFHRGES